MSLQNTPAAERIHIGIFGKRNAGKSSIINAITDQELAIVSDVKGTTTDPVLKTMELLPLGPVVLIDTPGLDDKGDLGALRIKKAVQMLNKTDIALLVVDGAEGLTKESNAILERIREKEIPYLIVYNKNDTWNGNLAADARSISVSAKTGENIRELKEAIVGLVPAAKEERPIVRDLLKPGDLVVLVIPVDSGAPKGRLILPQQQTIRDIMAVDAVPVLTKEDMIKDTLESLRKKAALVITDSQVLRQATQDTPTDIPLTSFSILFARYKGDLDILTKGAKALDDLEEGGQILISEGCTHHRQCEDIGTVKLPAWIREYSGNELRVSFTSGTEFPDNLTDYDLIIHCGGCMLNEREMKYRMKCAKDVGVPITNYGTCISYMNGSLQRTLLPFK